MGTLALNKTIERMPFVFEDYFKPWNEWFDNGGLWGRVMNIPAVNITENKDEYKVALAVPGMKKDDFKIDIDGNMLTISSEKEENKEEKDKKMSEDERKHAEDEVQKLTDHHIKLVDEVLKHKEKEIMEV